MLGEETSTDGPIHIYCSKQTNPLDFNGKGQLGVKKDDTMMLCQGSCQSYTGRVPITERFLNIFSFIHFFTIFCAIKMKQNQGKFFNFRFQLKMSCLY